MKIVPHPKLKRDYVGRTVRTVEQMTNGYVSIAPGTLAVVQSYSPRGATLKFERCACCGMQAIVSHVKAPHIEFVETA